MCSVTFHPADEGFRLAMNRDEQREREEALPPAWFRDGAHPYECPHEPGGGTWIAHDGRGRAWCLLNWYEKTSASSRTSITRGIIIPKLASGGKGGEGLSGIPYRQMAPFRIFSFDSSGKLIMEWRWDGMALEERSHEWAPFVTASSGWDEPIVSESRRQVWDRWIKREDAGTVKWLKELHSSHEPKEGACSFCMHREDAASVSLTLIECIKGRSALNYFHGQPCGN